MKTRGRRARSAKRPRRAARVADSRGAPRVNRRLAALAARILAGERIECAWELFRLQYFPGWKPARVAEALAAWSQREAVRVAFDIRHAHNVSMIYVVFAAR